MENKICNLCKSRKIKPQFYIREKMFDMPGKFLIKKCQECKLVFVSPRPNEKELRLYYPSDKYFAYDTNGKSGFYELIRQYIINNIYNEKIFNKIFSFFVMNNFAIPNALKNGKILDIGCGTGETLLLLKKLGWETYGIDIDKNACKIAKKQGVSHVKVGSYRLLKSYPDNYFDAIRLYHVIEHLDDPAFCISLIQKKLKKGGQFMFATPNVDSFISRIFKNHWQGYDGPRHLFLFSPTTLKSMLEKKHLFVNNIQYCSSQGILGIIQVIIKGMFKKKIILQNSLALVLITYLIEFILVRFHLSDSFIISGVKIKNNIKINI